MPSLNWIGKDAVVKHHRDVPYRLLEPVPELSCGDADSGNLIVQGDNLHALKALLPRYAGQVKCIYIDPPYNTGNEGWVYNDNVNSPEIRRWLGEVVGKEGETLDRHDRWLCMMYPRLVLLKKFLRDDGAIFVSIDDNEVATLRMLMDEVFGRDRFGASFVWKRRSGAMDSINNISEDHEYLLCYLGRSANLKGGRRTFAKYTNPDNDLRGDWIADNLSAGKPGGDTHYAITDPKTGNEFWPPKGRYWPYSRETMKRKIVEGRVLFPSKKTGSPLLKRFRAEAKTEIQPISTWVLPPSSDGDSTGIVSSQNTQATKIIKTIFADKVFNFAKPVDLIQSVIGQSTEQGDIVLDSFAGSGTTAHAILKQNAEDGGNRRFILVEMDEDIARNVTKERVKRVSQGYTNPKGEQVAGLGGSFQFCKLSKEPLFAADGQIREDVTFAQLAEFVWFSETGTGYKKPKKKSPLLGIHQGRTVYLLYNGILDDLAIDSGNVLTGVVLDKLPKHDGPRVIYAAACRLGTPRLNREGIVFKQTPYALDVSP